MSNLITVLEYVIAGVGMGLFYFGGLWATLQNLDKRTHPYLLLVSSFLIRVVILLVSLVLIIQLDWFALLGGLIGFFSIRFLLVYLINPNYSHN